MRNKLLHVLIEESCGKMHKKLKTCMKMICEALLRSKRLTVSTLGRELESPISDRHNIKRVDRFVSNKNAYAFKMNVYKDLSRRIVGNPSYLPLIIDTCCLSPDTKLQVLRASLPVGGRALTIYEEVYEMGELSSKMPSFLENLKIILPSDVKNVIIISDAGFHNRWFKLVENLGWDFVGRVRQNKRYIDSLGFNRDLKSLHARATSRPTYLGEVHLCEKNSIVCNLFIVKKRIKGRKKLNKKGNIHKNSYSKVIAKGQREPWVLATSLCPKKYSAKQIMRLYGLRMQIEEAFRDMKNPRYGFGLRHGLTKKVIKLEMLLLIALIGNFIAWLVGKVAEKNKWHFQYQSNTAKRRVLSHFVLGLLVLASLRKRKRQSFLNKTNYYLKEIENIKAEGFPF